MQGLFLLTDKLFLFEQSNATSQAELMGGDAERFPAATDKVQLVNERFPTRAERFLGATDKVPLVDE